MMSLEKRNLIGNGLYSDSIMADEDGRVIGGQVTLIVVLAGE